MTSATNLEPRIREIGGRLFAGAVEEGLLKTAPSLLGGRALQRRLLARAVDDPRFKTQLFRFIDLYPSLRDSGDLVRHLRAYLAERGEAPPPLDRMLSPAGTQRLPSWAVARLTDRSMQRIAKGLIGGRDATEALPALKRLRRRHIGFTLDILGEVCLSEAEAKDYLRRYLELLDALPPKVVRWGADEAIDQAPWGESPRVNLSVKLTSLSSRLDPLDFEGSREALLSVLKPLVVKARECGAFINVDLERFIYRDLTYAVFADLLLDNDLRDYPHVGVAVQAYLRDSGDDVQNLVDLARRRGTPFTVRLVKGAYWDYETIIAAQAHWPSPVFLDKAQTDAQFERLAAVLVDNWEWTRPALGTHNIRSMAAGLARAEAAGLPIATVELQFQHGMAESICRAAVAQGYRVREYVPVGELIPGVAYLVRRLLENTANESFLRLTFAQHMDRDQLLAPPETRAAMPTTGTAPPVIGAMPSESGVKEADTGEEKAAADATPPAGQGPPSASSTETLAPFSNEPHADFSRPENRSAAEKALATIRGNLGREYALLIDGLPVMTDKKSASVNPAHPDEVIGMVATAGRAEVDKALEVARQGFPAWRDTPARQRVAALLRAAALMRTRRFELAALEVLEAGKPWREADADVTEAIDFLEYYGREMLRLSQVRNLSDIPGEDDLYLYEPRGVAAVIAPWNFPLAIPTGMISAALVAGNTVVFKPASPASVLGYALVRILLEAGVPGAAINYLPGPGSEVGNLLAGDRRTDMVVFTGSLEVGLSIMQKAASVTPGQRNIKKVVAEMGGKNAIIIDTDADLDAAVEGVLISAFHYSGQKCSACSRVVVLEPVYEQFVRRLTEAVASLKVGDPADPGTRVGPVITAEARDRILGYVELGKDQARLVYPRGDEPSIEVPSPLISATEAPPSTVSVPADANSVGGADLVNTGMDGAPTVAQPTATQLEVGIHTRVEPGAPAEGDKSAVVDIRADATETADATAPAQPSGETSPPPASAGTPALAAEEAPPAEAGYFIRPHLFVDVPPDAVIAQEEIFGPVLAIFKVRKFTQALELALDVRYGLTGGLYSRNPSHIRRAYNDFRVGNLYINRPITGAMVGRQPFGGSRMSGVGSKAGGPDYLLQFLEPRVITENAIRRGFAPPPDTSSSK